ncbi:ABC transporter permease [Amycolatopsis thermoflava]|uniref:ABC transporter permease n=1 Tax=Amycolatopsis thermoflava TaxID=84480 RepID=UPI00040C8068|nr:ABC transporter permease [Amycolatopsis thermoflava]
MTTLRWTIADGWTMTRRELAHWARQPAAVIVSLLFPVLMLVMFGYLFGGAMAAPGDYREFLLPGMFVLAMAFGIETTFTGIATDVARGSTDRFRSLPMAASAPVTGRAVADLLNSVAGLVVLAACGLATGWRWHNGLGAALAAFGLLVLLRFALLWLGLYLGLVAKGPESVVALQILVWPLGFLSNVFVSPGTMPGWLGAIADANPLSATAAATRELFGNPGWDSGGWFAEHALLLAVLWPAAMIAVFLPLSVRRYRRLSR